MATSSVLTSRRTAISVVLAAPLALAACELDPPADPTPGARSPEPDPDSEPAPDTEVVAAARKSMLLMAASLEAAILAHTGLERELRGWLVLHAAHLEVLDDGSASYEVDAPVAVDRAPAARQRLLAEEVTLAVRLADGANQADSGDLARVLASMSAALRQRVID